jgi:hypothetical protein
VSKGVADIAERKLQRRSFIPLVSPPPCLIDQDLVEDPEAVSVLSILLSEEVLEWMGKCTQERVD